MRIAMVVAEPSGDNIAANLIRAMKAQDIAFEISGICGPAMVKEGAIANYSIDEIASLGVEGLFGRLRKILKIRRDYVQSLLLDPPDVFIGIDAPDFNLSIEERLREAGIPTIQYVAPTVWAWRGYRIHKLKRAVEHLLSIYPFESALFEKTGISFTYVGHPLASQIASRDSLPDRTAYGARENDKVVAILPGSRINEVRRLAHIFLRTAVNLSQTEPNLKFVAPFANHETFEHFEQVLNNMATDIRIEMVMHDSLNVIGASDLVIAASGTAALEAALLGKPVVVSYRVSQLTYWMVKLLSKTRHYSMLNHFSGGPIIPEFMQSDCTVGNIRQEALRLLQDTKYRASMLEKFASIAKQLQCDTHHLAVREILRVAKR